MTTCPRCWKENVEVHTCTPLPTTPVGGTVEGDKFLVLVTCKCGKRFNIPYQQWFSIDLRGDFFVKCACGGSYNLFDEGKKSLERQGVTLPTPKSQEAVDVEKIADKIATEYHEAYWLNDPDALRTRITSEFDKILTALPIAGKKFTKDEIEGRIRTWVDDDWREFTFNEVKNVVLSMYESHWLLAD